MMFMLQEKIPYPFLFAEGAEIYRVVVGAAESGYG